MKQYIYSVAAVLCLASIGLTSCQNDVEEMGNAGGKEVLLRVTANRGDAGTRTTLEANATGGLDCKWSEGDKLLVVNNSNGSKLGVITLVDGVGTPDGTFEGKVTLDNLDAVSLVYLGTAGDAEAYNTNNIQLDLSAQDGTFASLTSNDVLTAEVKVTENTYLPTGNVVETSVTMTRQLAFGYFNLDFSGAGDLNLAAGDVITITGEGLKSEGKINFKKGGSIPTVTNYSGKTEIVVTKTEVGNDFFITMLPVGNVTPTFTVVKDGVTYTASLGAHNWKAGEYVRKDNTGAAVSVSMEPVKKIDHSVNPLAKWAEGDLVRSGSGKAVTGKISDNPLASGSYYQFGRNYGYNSASEVTQLSTEMSLSNNYFTFRGVSYKATPENGVFSASSQKVQVSQTATSITLMTDYPAMFFMNAGDYVTPSYTQDWQARAKAMGYTYETPCPDGWTIPSKADFEQILPVSGTTVGSTSWTTITQIKEIGSDKVPCAFRWSKEGNALKIESLVLAEKDDDPDWSDDNVVIRYFALSGCLTSFMQSGTITQGTTKTDQYVANVLSYGKYDTSATLGATQGWTNIYYMKITQQADYMSQTGFYWTKDADQQVFTLNTNSGISSYKVGYNFTQSTVTIGANIRCIKK